MKHLFFIFCLGTVLFLSACSTPKTLPVNHVQEMGSTPVSEGFFYILPRTVVSVDVSVTRTESTPGPFSEYAGRYLGLEDVISRGTVQYEISRVTVNNYAEPDPAHIYFVPFNALKNEAYFVSLSESGLIQSVNVEFDYQEFIKGLSQTQDYGFFGTDNTFNHFIDLNLQERIDTIMERVRIDTLTVERQTLRRSWVEKSTDIRAREVADYILKIRDKKFDLISGFAEIPYSKEALEYMHNELNTLEEDYLKLFKGIKGESTINYRYTIIPDPASKGKSSTLFRFSAREGVISTTRQDGYPVSIEFMPSQTTQGLPLSARPIAGEGDRTSGFFYRIPEYATAVVREGNILRAESRFLVNQFGAVSRIAPQGMQLEFYPNTGSVKTIGTLENQNK